jgi:hypothetical protein
MIDSAARTRVPTPAHFPPSPVVGWRRRAAGLDGHGAWAAGAALGLCAAPVRQRPQYPFAGAEGTIAPATRGTRRCGRA